jgi:hypothetical protein
MITTHRIASVFGLGLWLAGCASSPRARPESAQRVPDSAPEKIAAQRSAAGLHLEEDDDRWGIEQARELRRRKADDQKKKDAALPAQPAIPPPADIQCAPGKGPC